MEKKETNKVLIVGYEGHLHLFRNQLDQLGIAHQETSDAHQGLEVTAVERFPLILLNDYCAAGELDIPIGRLEDPVFIGCEFMTRMRARGKNTTTPVVLMHVNRFRGYTSQDALARYKSAGVTETFNWTQSSLEDFRELLDKYPK